jgi:uncharacterized membrane protein (UPF0127 family)
MKTVAILVLLAQQSLPAAAAPTVKCLPGEDGFLTMRLRGSIEADVRWREPELDCTGMPRPDGKGFRVRFAGALPGGGLSVVFAAPALPPGSSGRGVPVNVTLIDDAGKTIYGTQGDDHCTFDEVAQDRLEDAELPAPAYRVKASGFCISPARALDGDGSVMLTRFDFAGLVSEAEDDGAPREVLPPHFARLPTGTVRLTTRHGAHTFDVWIAADDASRERGLMHVKELASDRGMLFIFDPPQPVAFWMKDTPLSLDLVFIGPDGTVLNVAENATPFSQTRIESDGPVAAVLEVAAGTAKRIAAARGDTAALPTLPTTGRRPDPSE